MARSTSKITDSVSVSVNGEDADVKGPDPSQWSDEARAERGADIQENPDA